MLNKINESYEDYLKAIYIISKKNRGGWVSNSEISNLLQVKPSSVTDMLHKLREKDLINWKPRNSIRLTVIGKEIAKNIFKRYNLLKEFFTNVLKLKENSKLEDLCCKIEHHVTSEVTTALENFGVLD
ncbi:MAG: metal-dependent transcriptional regulator [Promethearchaeota archaeon]